MKEPRMTPVELDGLMFYVDNRNRRAYLDPPMREKVEGGGEGYYYIRPHTIIRYTEVKHPRVRRKVLGRTRSARHRPRPMGTPKHRRKLEKAGRKAARR